MVWGGGTASAEILAMMNYESKTPDQVKALKLTGPQERREGIAIIDVDPESAGFGKLLVDIPLDPAGMAHHIFYDRTMTKAKLLVDIPLDPAGMAHHIFYDRTMTKAYLTALAQPALQVMDLTEFPYRLRTIDVPNCVMAEDLIVDAANENWYLTCMNSANVWRGSVATDEITGEIKLPGTYPHGLAVDTDIDRIVVTSTITADLKSPQEVVSVVRASTLEPLSEIKLSLKESPSGEAPVEILAVPGAAMPTFYVTNMFGATLWAMAWNEAAQDFDASQVFDFNTLEAGVLLEMYFNTAGDRMYVTTGVPGQIHIFDMSGGALSPKLVKSLPAAGGAHHVGITKDERYGFVQNALLNLPGMNDGSITVVDLAKGEVVGSVNTLKDMGLNPNSLVLLPEWNHFAGH
jgi:DNA-binding beta-propeller fold protein YncE